MSKRKAIKKIRRDFYVYRLTRPDEKDPFYPDEDQPFYFGRGCNGRIYAHRVEAEKYKDDPTMKVVNLLKTRIIVKLWEYGEDFKEEIVVSGLTNEEANEIEMAAIAFYGRIDLGTGCLANMNDGGKGALGREPWNKGKKGLFYHTDEAKERIREGKLGEKNPAFGVPKSEKWYQAMEDMGGENHWTQRMEYPESARHKISISLIGTARAAGKRSPEACKNISEGHKGQIPWMKGRHHSEESRASMRKPHGGNAGHNKDTIMSEEQKVKISNTKRKRFTEKVYIKEIVEHMIQIEDEYGQE